MADKYLDSFLEGLRNVLMEFGMSDIEIGDKQKKDTMSIDMDVTSVISFVGAIKGNISYSLSQDTAKQIVSVMTGGMDIQQIDMMTRSAISEAANMFAARAALKLFNTGTEINISPPSIVFGKNIFFFISSVQTILVVVKTPAGNIDVSIGLEI